MLPVFMTQKKLLNFLVIGRDLLHQGQELRNQGQRQARFGPDRDRIGSQTRLMQLLEDVRSDFGGRGVPSRLEHLADLFRARYLRRL